MRTRVFLMRGVCWCGASVKPQLREFIQRRENGSPMENCEGTSNYSTNGSSRCAKVPINQTLGGLRGGNTDTGRMFSMR
jgi:hypothetical protein